MPRLKNLHHAPAATVQCTSTPYAEHTSSMCRWFCIHTLLLMLLGRVRPCARALVCCVGVWSGRPQPPAQLPVGEGSYDLRLIERDPEQPLIALQGGPQRQLAMSRCDGDVIKVAV